MAYRSRGRSTYSRPARRRAPVRTARRSRSTGRVRRTSQGSRAQTVRLVIQQAPASPAAAPFAGQAQYVMPEAAKKSKF